MHKPVENYAVQVSIIMAAYNSAKYISTAIESVLAQSYQSWELIIVDDASTDQTFYLVNSFVKRYSNIKCLKLEQNLGSGPARNAGIDLAAGRFLAFLDSDDIWLSQKLERQLAFMLQNDYALSCTFYKEITDTDQLTGHMVQPREKIAYHDMLNTNMIGCSTAIYDLSKISKDYKMPDLRVSQDFCFWLQILKSIDFAYCLPECLVLYRANNGFFKNKFRWFWYDWLIFRRIERFSIVRTGLCLLMLILNSFYKRRSSVLICSLLQK